MSKLKERDGKLVFTPGGKVSTQCDYQYAMIQLTGLTGCSGFPPSCVEDEIILVPITLNGSGGYDGGPHHHVMASGCLGLTHIYVPFITWLDSGSPPDQNMALQVQIGTGIGGIWLFDSRTGLYICDSTPCHSGLNSVPNDITGCGTLDGLPIGTHSGFAEVTAV